MPAETIEHFYHHKFNAPPPADTGARPDHFNVFRLEDSVRDGQSLVQYPRRSYYKIALMRGHHRYHYVDHSLETSGPTLIFFNPAIPYQYEALTDDATGFFCIFTGAFLADRMRCRPGELTMFSAGSIPAYALAPDAEKAAAMLFSGMLAEIGSDYRRKYDLIANYALELIHLGLKLEPSESLYQHPNAYARLTGVFTELLERQFPIETPAQRLELRSAKDFAAQLAVHVNHLNRALKATTGKTTTTLIAERVAAEARALLRHTTWNVSEISYSLGFEEPAYFAAFFKKHTAASPSAFRAV